MDAPFLELAFYTGTAGIRSAVERLAGNVAPNALTLTCKRRLPNLVGLIDGPEEIESIGGTVMLRTEGEAFCGPARRNTGQLKKLGRRVYERFVEVADTITCFYGAILVEYTLEEPEELLRDPRSLAFVDFFLSAESLSSETIQLAITIAGAGVFVERRKRGFYISMSAEFNPNGSHVDPLEAQLRSAKISALIGQAAR